MDSKKSSESEAITQLAGTVSMLIDLTSRLMREHENSRLANQSVLEEIKESRAKIERLVKVIHEGNGERSLTTRIAVLEDKVKSLNEDMNSAQETRLTNENARISGKWAVIVAVISSIGLLGAAFLGSKLFG